MNLLHNRRCLLMIRDIPLKEKKMIIIDDSKSECKNCISRHTPRICIQSTFISLNILLHRIGKNMYVMNLNTHAWWCFCTYLWIKVDWDEFVFFISVEKWLCQIKGASLIHSSNPFFIDLFLKTENKCTVLQMPQCLNALKIRLVNCWPKRYFVSASLDDHQLQQNIIKII